MNQQNTTLHRSGELRSCKLSKWFPIRIEDAEDDGGAIFFEREVGGVGEIIDGFDPDVIAAYGPGGWQSADLLKVDIQRVSELNWERDP